MPNSSESSPSLDMQPRLPRHGGGWHSIIYTVGAGRRAGFFKLWQAMRSRNACKTCALGMGGQAGGMRNERGNFPEVCKKSLQAMVADMQGAIAPDFFRRYPVSVLKGFSPRELESFGRLTFPVRLKPGASHYEPISWDAALEQLGSRLAKTAPDAMFFYASGRSSNEAGFLLQLLARALGTNNVNNCSYYCHQASGVALGQTLGTGTATVSLDDLESSDAFFLIGGNPASNHPRLLTTLMHLRRRGGRVIVINPLRERGLERFSIPSDVRSLLFGSEIATHYLQPHIGGDIAVMTGIAKALLERSAGDKNPIDMAFIGANTTGWAGVETLVASTQWSDIERESGVTRAEIEAVANVYATARNAVFGWTMGITHHLHGVENVEWIVNLALMRGMVGRPGAGLLPIRGHSNVQGIGSMGVTPKMRESLVQHLGTKGIAVPETAGLDTMASMDAADAGRIRFALCLGGNLYGSNPDPEFAGRAFARIDQLVYLSTTLNTGHAHGLGGDTIILPVLARDEELQPTTQESMFNFVRISDGGIARHPGVRSEVQIIAELGARCLSGPALSALDWKSLGSHGEIRRMIAECVPGYQDVGSVTDAGREFVIPGRVLHEPKFSTPDGRAHFSAHPIPVRSSSPEVSAKEQNGVSRREINVQLMTIRSEGQFNTVVYEEEDVYRGQERRDVILLNAADMSVLGLRPDALVTVTNATGTMRRIRARPFPVRRGNAAMYYPEANVLVPRSVDPRSRTPAFKAVAVTLRVESEPTRVEGVMP